MTWWFRITVMIVAPIDGIFAGIMSREWRDDILGAFPFVLGHGPISVRAVAFWIVVSIPVTSVAWQLYAAHEEATKRPEWANDLMQEIKRDMLAAMGGATREERERHASTLIDGLEVLFAKSAPGGRQIDIIAKVFEGDNLLAEKVFTNISAANAVGSPVEFNTLRIEIVAQPVGEGGAVLENGALGRVPKVLDRRGRTLSGGNFAPRWRFIRTCQLALTQSVAVIQRIRRGVYDATGIPEERFSILSWHADIHSCTCLSELLIIDACANFFKHQYEWPPDWDVTEGTPSQHRTIAIVRRLGLSPGDVAENLQIALQSINISTDRIRLMGDKIQAWRERVVERLRLLLNERDNVA